MPGENSAMTDPLSGRAARAERYFKNDLQDQRQWYGKRASVDKNRAQLLSFVVITAGAATSFFQVFSPAPWLPALTAALGAMVALSEGWQRIARYAETWVAYRTASERMKREQRLYVNGAGAYRRLDDEEAFLQFVENIEAVIAEEEQIYWRNRGSQGGQSAGPLPTADSGLASSPASGHAIPAMIRTSRQDP
jgi:Protein of unknown function (DUF4231)